MERRGRPCEPITLKCNGTITHYESKTQAANDIGVSLVCLSTNVRRMKDRPAKNAKINGKLYFLMEEQNDL